MSRTNGAEPFTALGADGRRFEAYENRETSLGALKIYRALPVKGRRMIGPWCFLDRYGPLSFTEGMPMDVAPHPHIGLQTVTWLLDGEVAHDDSLRCESVLRPGGVNVMTSGGGIAHAERTPADHSGRLNGVQLWTALPESARHDRPSFEHVDEVPLVETPGGIARVFAGGMGDAVSPARYFSPLVGADLEIHAGATLTLPLEPGFEHGVLVLSGDGVLEGQPLLRNMLYYLGSRRDEVSITSGAGARVLLTGGAPFPEPILMWWNFVARTPDEIADARSDWEHHRRFGDVPAYSGPRLEAPSLLKFARPNPAS